MKSGVIILNGTSSAGKTSIAKALQRLSPTPILHASLDTFTDMFHWPAITDPTDRQACHRVGVSNFHAALPLLASSPFPVVVDHVFERAEWREACINVLKGKRLFLVGVRCPLDLLEEREKVRGDRRIGLARWQFGRVHEHGPYAFEVDSSLYTPDECASAIFRFIRNEEME